MPDAAWHECTGTGDADRDVITDQESDLATQDISHLVAVVMEVQCALGPDRSGRLEHHDAAIGLVTPQLKHDRPPRRVVRHQAVSRLYDNALPPHRAFLLPSLRSEPA